MKLYNTLTGKKETFKSQRDKKINLFVCGPTVYDYTHLGHARTYVAFDVMAKYLKEKGYDVFYLQNITDIDDKIIQRAKEKNTTVKELAKFFEKEYLKDMKALKVNSITKYARATDYYKEILSQVKRLKSKGFAYETSDGIYYDISKFKNYGKLSGRTVLQAEDAVSRIDESVEKKNKGDFCLWKFGQPDRPGWHIEDTAIAEKFFGTQYDMHGGAKDLIFPHHEAEIAQMEAISGKSPMVKYWIHTGFLTVNRKKMSKSLGNFITIQDFIKKYSPRILRFLIAKNYYRSPMDYTEASVAQAKKELARIDEFISRGRTSPLILGEVRPPNIRKYEKAFEQAMDDDFNTPKAMACIFDLMKEQKTNSADILKFLKKIDRVLGFIFWPEPKITTPPELLSLAEQRQQYRKNGDWQKADQIRKNIMELGWQVEDTKDGPKLKRVTT